MNSFTPFKKYDYILNNTNLLIAEKIFALIELWKKMSEFDFSELNLNETVDLVDWALLHTMNIALTAEWTHYMDLFETQLLTSIKKASECINKVSKGFEQRFVKIIYVIKNTWNIPTLDVIMKTENLEINKQFVEFFETEQAHLVSVRLIKLCDANCEDLALNLATTFLKYLEFVETSGKKVQITKDQVSFIFDIRISLFYKWGKMRQFESAVNQLTYKEGSMCINRFLNKKPNLLKIWKYSQKIATTIMQILLENIVVHNRTDQKLRLVEILETYLGMNTASDCFDEFSPKIRRICELAEPCMLQTICNVFKNVNNRHMYPFIVEMFIKALTTDMNELEAQKERKENNEDEEDEEVTYRLAEMFCSLGDFMKDKIKVARECALTAFSLQPTVERLHLLESLAKRSGLPVLDTTEQWKCKRHPVTSSMEDLLWECPDCREYMCKPQLNIPMKSNLALYEAIQTLDLPETICEDLIICISNPRYQVLTWYLPWMVLHRLCVMYLKDPLRTKNYVTELNFLDIDYSRFANIQKDQPTPYAGIEKGYEKYLNKDYNGEEDSEEESGTDNCAIEGDEYDPNSMESLKRILSLQSTKEVREEETEETEEAEIEDLTEDRDETRRSWTTSSSVKSYLVDESFDQEKHAGGLKNLKRKFSFFTKEKRKKNVKKLNETVEESDEVPRVKVLKKSRCPIFGKTKSK